MVANSDNYMGMGTGNYLPQNYTNGRAPVAPMGTGGNPAIPYPNQPRPAAYSAPSQYANPYRQQFAPQQQQRFSMPPPPQRSYPQQQQQYNLAGIMGARNLGQQQQMPRPQQQLPQQPGGGLAGLGQGRLAELLQQSQQRALQGPDAGMQAAVAGYQRDQAIANSNGPIDPARLAQFQANAAGQASQANLSPQQQQELFQRTMGAQQMTGRSNMNLQDVNTARNALGMGDLPQDGRKQMPSQGPQPMGGKGIGPQAIQAMQAQQGQPGAQFTPQAMGGKGNRMSMDMPQRPSPIGGKGASED